MIKKTIHFIILTGILLSGCATLPTSPEPTLQPVSASLATATSLPPEAPTETPTPTATPTFIPTNTLAPTATRAPTRTSKPTATPFGGGGGRIMMFISMNIVGFQYPISSDIELTLSSEDMQEGLEINEFSTFREDSISPQGKLAAFWNCSTRQCDTERGILYVFTPDLKQKASIEIPGHPYFLGWSADEDRLLYYLNSTMADEYFLIKTKSPGFGEVISLGRMSSASWANDKKTLYVQKGNTIRRLDEDGNELNTFECNFNNACANSPAPDGKHFAGIQKYVPTGVGNPVITITNQDFSQKKSIFISDDDALILGIEWLPDSQHIVVYGQSAQQRIRRFWRLDYLSIIDIETGEERVIRLAIPEDSEWFAPCGLTPDGTHLVYLGAGGRVKEQGRILMGGRYAYMFPVESETPTLEQITELSDFWESCPVWLP